jgi:hypothetical protein
LHVEVEKAPQFVDVDCGIAAQQAAALSQSAQLPVPVVPPEPVVPAPPVAPPAPVVVPPVAAPVPPLPPVAIWHWGMAAVQATKSLQLDFPRQVLAALTSADSLVHFCAAQIVMQLDLAMAED